MDLHEKAERLIEGGIIEIQGRFVEMRHEPYLFDPCFVCDLNSKCHQRGEIAQLCLECDSLTNEDCYFKFYDRQIFK